MNEFWQTLGHNLAQHLTSLGLGSGFLFFAAVHNMPEKPPSTMQDYWTWIRESLQSSIPVRQLPRPTPPVTPAKE